MHKDFLAMDPEELAAIDHTHCLDCYRVDCRKRVSVYPTKCPVIACELLCGAKFHACKLGEHKELCRAEKVQCINYVNGCPLLIQRNKLNSHLQRCPASVVYCTMEWNRWPVYSQERLSRVPFLSDNLHAQYGQLDAALALRDQRMLNAALKAPRSTRRVLKNDLTQRFPAVPIRLNSSSGFGSNGQINAQEDPGGDAGGASGGGCGSGSSIGLRERLSAIYSQKMKDALISTSSCESINDADVDTASDGGSNHCRSLEAVDNCHWRDTNGNKSDAEESAVTNGDGGHEFLADNGGLDSGEYHTKMTENGPELSYRNHNVSDEGSDELTVYSNTTVDIPLPPCPAPLLTLKETLALDLNMECISRYHAKPRSMYTFLCAQEFRRDEFCDHFKNVHDEIHGGLNGWLEQRCPLAHYGCTYSIRKRYPNEPGAKVIYNSIQESYGVVPQASMPMESVGGDGDDDETQKQQQQQQDGTSDEDICKTKILKEVMMNSGTKTSKSPFKFSLSNVNDSEGLNGNHASEKELISNGVNAKLNQQEKAVDVPVKPDFNALPFEVLRHVMYFLDGQSLCNVAITSRLLRDVACSLLEEKGIVIPQWGKRIVDGQSHWTISHKRWIFSNAFTPVKSWGFEEYVPFGEHLKTCPFFHRSRISKPHRLPNMKCGRHHSNNFHDVMNRMYPDFQPETDCHQEGVCNGDTGFC